MVDIDEVAGKREASDRIDQINPCPWCGGRMVVETKSFAGTDKKLFRVECESCGGCVGPRRESILTSASQLRRYHALLAAEIELAEVGTLHAIAKDRIAALERELAAALKANESLVDALARLADDDDGV